MDKLLQFITNPSNDYLGHSIVYIQLCLASVVLAMLIGVVLGIAVSGNPLLAFIAVNVSGLMRAIPVIAFLVAVLPYLGLGFLPALIALTVLGIPPILLNTYTGIRGIDPATIDAARGMGMTQQQIVSKIQAPLVLPIIAAGVRTSAVQVIATATLAAVIGAGGYGEYILSGLYQLDDIQILAGAIPVAILALIAEVLLSQLQRALTPKGLRIQAIA
ncbi:MAG TPA: ABC transporter permease [Ktedonobacteraceae bacterium]|nr:ABC transporter permease [Ktedonobacteraceae bacterium]